MRTLIIKVGSYLPRCIQYFTYYLGYLFLSVYAHDVKYLKTINIRHSVRLNSFVFGKSDLDLTAVFEIINLEEISKLRNKINRLKKIIPFIGELNIYSLENSIFLKIANSYEISRDPDTLKLFGIDKEFKDSEKIVYLLRDFFSDRENLRSNYQVRQRKWHFHFNHINCPVKNSELVTESFIFNFLSESLGEYDPNGLREWKKALDFFKKNELINNDFYWSNDRPIFISILFPHMSMWGEAKNVVTIESLNHFQKSILKAQLSWEIWGISSQLRLESLHDQILKEHLQRLSIPIYALGDSNLIKAYNELLTIIASN